MVTCLAWCRVCVVAVWRASVRDRAISNEDVRRPRSPMGAQLPAYSLLFIICFPVCDIAEPLFTLELQGTRPYGLA